MLGDLIPEVIESKLPKVNPVKIEQDEEELEDAFFFAIKSFLDDIFEVRSYVASEWRSYKVTGEGLIRTALLSNTAVDLVRCAERQFEHELSRPKKYPAKDFPVWTLPVLLFFDAHNGFKEGTISIDDIQLFSYSAIQLFIKPSFRTRPSDYACEQERYCMWRVYAALKIYLFIVKNHIRDTHTPITPTSMSTAHETFPEETWDTLFWAQVFRLENDVGANFAHDEALWGIKHMLDKNEVPIWVTFAMQIHLDIGKVLENKGTLAAPFNEYQETVRQRSTQCQKNDKIVRSFLESPNNTQVAPFYKTMTNILRDHREIALEDLWRKRIKTNQMQDHEVVGKTFDETDFSKLRAMTRCHSAVP